MSITMNYSPNILLQAVQRFFSKTPRFMVYMQVALALVTIVTGLASITVDLLTNAHAALPTWLSLVASANIAKTALGMILGLQFAIPTSGTPPVAGSVASLTKTEQLIIDLASLIQTAKTALETPPPTLPTTPPPIPPVPSAPISIGPVIQVTPAPAES